MKCPRCLNTDPAYFYHGSKGWYCRRCIQFSRVLLEEEKNPVSLSTIPEHAEEYTLKYPLTKDQSRISRQCAEGVKESDVLIFAVTGAGKTELVVESIASVLKRKQKVCFAIARRQVVLELQQRLQEIFTESLVIAVCGGHTAITDGDLIVCTTHQLYRYYQAFDLLILDEPDAFPYRGDAVLHGIAETACRGHRIYLTATPDEQLLNQVKQGTLIQLKLNSRPHGHPLPVPVLFCAPEGFLLIRLLHWIHAHSNHPRMIFVPKIIQAERMGKALNLILGKCDVCTSHTEARDDVIQHFRSEPAGLIVATTVLERGVTVPGADVCVYEADSRIFDEAGLIQMAGRAGRSFVSPEGDVLFLLKERSLLAERCVSVLKEANTSCGV